MNFYEQVNYLLEIEKKYPPGSKQYKKIMQELENLMEKYLEQKRNSPKYASSSHKAKE